MDADDLKKRTKLFALRVLKLAAALPNTIDAKSSGDSWFELEHRLERTTEPVAVRDQERSSSQKSAL